MNGVAADWLDAAVNNATTVGTPSRKRPLTSVELADGRVSEDRSESRPARTLHAVVRIRGSTAKRVDA
jgi:hypothetical protein